MTALRVDVAVVGGGSAGLSALRELRRRGKRVALIDRPPHGTTCARAGCMPSKLLIAAAERAHEARGASVFGVRTQVTVDGAAVMERVRAWRDRFVDGVLRGVEEHPAELRLEGSARFVGERALEVEGRRVEFESAVVAVGTRPRVPPELEAVRELVLTSDSVFELRELPGSLAVAGAGPVALELGQAFQRLGVRVALFAPRERLGPLRDPRVAAAARELLGAELDLHLGVEGLTYEHDGEGAVLRWRERGEAREDDFERVLVAAGRTSALEELDLPAAGVELDEGGRPPYDPATTRLGATRLFLAGDATGDRPLLHEAADEGRIAAANAASYPEVRAHRRRAPLAIVFTDPQLAVVGAPHDELESGGDLVVGEVDFARQGRAQVLDRARGLGRVYATRDGRLAGAELCAPRAEHMAHLLAWSIQSGLSVRDALAMPVYHPVLEEGLRSALRELGRQLGLSAEACARGLDCGAGS